MRRTPVIDVFAGPGGLGEGFSSLEDTFEIRLSVEAAEAAHQTLRLRAFKRLLERGACDTSQYYDYLNGHAVSPYNKATADLWEDAGREAVRLTLGEPVDNEVLERRLESEDLGDDWVLIGGPPCQAYSIVGRSRNRGKAGYVPEKDARHFLYREYLKLIQRFRPAVFVMENVKGLLTSRVGGGRIFEQILRDLVSPDEALDLPSDALGYRIYSLAHEDAVFERGMDPGLLPGDAFLLEAERYGVPQTRHRVILLGVREDIKARPRCLDEQADVVTVESVLAPLPRIRSRLSRRDGYDRWLEVVCTAGRQMIVDARKADLTRLADVIDDTVKAIRTNDVLGLGGTRIPRSPDSLAVREPVTSLSDWYRDDRLEVWLNHEARSHMDSDLARYLFASCFASAYGRTPKANDFILPGLAPDHANWTTGFFDDRFRVHVWDEPAKTVTSHIHKDGHYFIHPDATQCRTFTVREAARLQTFPDNYFFEGTRTNQYIQVGNAVPPFLARQIAVIVQELLLEKDGAPASAANASEPQGVLDLA